MNDKKLIDSIIRKSALDLVIAADEELALVGELQKVVGVGDDTINSDDQRFREFDAFGFAWDRLLRDDRLRLMAAAYRRNRDLFAQITMENRLRWHNFNYAQKSALINSCDEVLLSAARLLSSKTAAADFISGYVEALKDKEREAVMKAINERAAA